MNIFYEVHRRGEVVVTNDNYSINEFIEPDLNCLLYGEDNFTETAGKTAALMDDPERNRSICAAAHLTAKDSL